MSKLRYFVNKDTLRSIYFALFQSHINYVSIVWGHKNSQRRISILQKKALRILNFTTFNAHTTVLFKEWNILKFDDVISIESCLFINNCFNKKSFFLFSQDFSLVSNTHEHNTRSSSKGLLFVPSYNSLKFGRKSIINSATLIWNHLQGKFSENDFLSMTPNSLKAFLSELFIDNY